MPLVNFGSDDSLFKYSPDQERDDHGRFGSGGGSSSADSQKANDIATASAQVERNKGFIQTSNSSGYIMQMIRDNRAIFKDMADKHFGGDVGLATRTLDPKGYESSLKFYSETIANALDTANNADAYHEDDDEMYRAMQDASRREQSFADSYFGGNKEQAIQALKDYKSVSKSEDSLTKYSPDQERDENGRFGSGSGSSIHDKASQAVEGLREHIASKTNLVSSVKQEIRGHLKSAADSVERSQRYHASGDPLNAGIALRQASASALRAERLAQNVPTRFTGSSVDGAEYSHNDAKNLTPSDIGSQAIDAMASEYTTNSKKQCYGFF